MPYRNKITGEVISDEEFQRRKAANLILPAGTSIPQTTSQTTPAGAPQYRPSTKSSFVEEYETQKAIKEGEEAKKFLEMPWYKQLFTGRVLKEVPGATAQVLLKEPARFVRSTIEIPHTLTTGRPEEKVTKLPLIGEIPSYQKEAYERTMAGEPLWKAIGIPAGKAILGGIHISY